MRRILMARTIGRSEAEKGIIVFILTVQEAIRSFLSNVKLKKRKALVLPFYYHL